MNARDKADRESAGSVQRERVAHDLAYSACKNRSVDLLVLSEPNEKQCEIKD